MKEYAKFITLLQLEKILKNLKYGLFQNNKYIKKNARNV